MKISSIPRAKLLPIHTRVSPKQMHPQCLMLNLHLHPPPSIVILLSKSNSHSSLHFSPSSSSSYRRITRQKPNKFPRSLCSYCFDSSTSTSSSSFTENEFDNELGCLLALLPEEMRQRVMEHPELNHLIEVVMDLGRNPLARFPSGDFILSNHPITFQDLEVATSQVSNRFST